MLNEGVKSSGKSFMFDFDSDATDDMIKLTEKVNSVEGFASRAIYYAYEFSEDVDSLTRSAFIKELKFGPGHESPISDEERNRFIKEAVNKLHEEVDINSFDAVVYPESSSDIVTRMLRFLYFNVRSKMHSFKLVKSGVENLGFDFDKYFRLCGIDYTQKQREEVIKNVNLMLDRIHGLDYFSIAKDVKPKYRNYLRNFYTFQTEQEADLFEAINGGRVLLVDDIATSGATLSFMQKTVDVFEPKEMVLFSLIGNNKLGTP